MRAVYANPILANEKGERARADVIREMTPARTAAFLRERLAAIAAIRQPPVPEPAPPAVPEPPPCAPVLAAQLEIAERDAAEAERMVSEGITFKTSSRFGWPGRVLRTAVMRVLRPYAHFEARAHQQHLRATVQMLACLRAIDDQLTASAGAPPNGEGAAGPPEQGSNGDRGDR